MKGFVATPLVLCLIAGVAPLSQVAAAPVILTPAVEIAESLHEASRIDFAVDELGNGIAAWEHVLPAAGEPAYMARRLATGSPIGLAFNATPAAGVPDRFELGGIALATNGGFALVDAVEADYLHHQVRLQRFDPAGERLGDTVVVADEQRLVQLYARLDVRAALSPLPGGWLVGWTRWEQQGLGNYVVANPRTYRKRLGLRVIDTNGIATSPALLLDASLDGIEPEQTDAPSLAATPSGAFAAWTLRDLYRDVVHLRAIDTSGNPVLARRRADGRFSTSSRYPQVAVSEGGAAVVWQGSERGSRAPLTARFLNTDGTTAGSPLSIAIDTALNAPRPVSAALTGDGTLIVAYLANTPRPAGGNLSALHLVCIRPGGTPACDSTIVTPDTVASQARLTNAGGDIYLLYSERPIASASATRDTRVLIRQLTLPEV